MNAFITSPPGGLLDAATALPTQIFIWADSPERGFVSRTSAAILVLLGLPDRHERHRHLPAPAPRAYLVSVERTDPMSIIVDDPMLKPASATVARPRPKRRRPKITARDVTVHYGEKQALFDVSVDIPANQVTVVHRPVGLRQVDLPALPQPDERHHPDRPGRRRDQARRHGHLRPAHRRGRAARPRRHGVPEAEPVPEVDLRERRLRPEDPRHDAATRPSSTSSSTASITPRRPVERGQGPAERARHRPLRRPAAAAVHRARHRDPARGAADGRALLGARPDRHRDHRGADRRAARPTTPSSSSPTRCSRPRASASAPPSSTSAS